MGNLEAQAEPLAVSVEDGEVVMTGNRVAVALTPPAAKETGEKLVSAADELLARDQAPQTPASDS